MYCTYVVTNQGVSHVISPCKLTVVSLNIFIQAHFNITSSIITKHKTNQSVHIIQNSKFKKKTTVNFTINCYVFF